VVLAVAATTMLLLLLLLMVMIMMMIRLYKDAGKQNSYFSSSNKFYINFQAKCGTALMKTIIFSRTTSDIAGTQRFRATFSGKSALPQGLSTIRVSQGN
jgi:hypothetical protein